MAVNRIAGALTLILGGWSLGRSLLHSTLREKRRLELLCKCIEELRYEVTKLETPLPQLLDRLEREKELTGGNHTPTESGDFPSRWRAFSFALLLDDEVKETVAELGLSLCRSHEPEKCFERAALSLNRCRDVLEKSCAERRQLLKPLCACAGVLLALMLW